MTKLDKKIAELSVVETKASEPVSVPEPVMKLSIEDVNELEKVKVAAKLALANAERALAENKAADVTYKYVVLQLYMKYGLTAADALDEQGNIHRGVANQG